MRLFLPLTGMRLTTAAVATAIVGLGVLLTHPAWGSGGDYVGMRGGVETFPLDQTDSDAITSASHRQHDMPTPSVPACSGPACRQHSAIPRVPTFSISFGGGRPCLP